MDQVILTSSLSNWLGMVLLLPFTILGDIAGWMDQTLDCPESMDLIFLMAVASILVGVQYDVLAGVAIGLGTVVEFALVYIFCMFDEYTPNLLEAAMTAIKPEDFAKI